MREGDKRWLVGNASWPKSKKRGSRTVKDKVRVGRE